MVAWVRVAPVLGRAQMPSSIPKTPIMLDNFPQLPEYHPECQLERRYNQLQVVFPLPFDLGQGIQLASPSHELLRVLLRKNVWTHVAKDYSKIRGWCTGSEVATASAPKVIGSCTWFQERTPLANQMPQVQHRVAHPLSSLLSLYYLGPWTPLFSSQSPFLPHKL